MNLFLTQSVELAGLVAAIGAIMFAILSMRNPFAPRWMRTDVAAEAASLALVGVISLAVAFALKGLIAAGLNFFGAAGVIFGIIVVATVLLWTIFRVGERLKRADHGRSPFEELEPRPGKPRLGAPTR